MTAHNTLGAILLKARKQKGLSQIDVAKALGYDYNPVNIWERNLHKPIATDWEDLKQLLSPELGIAAVESLYEHWTSQH
jgi:transcriptional regulator with XRE-family HTH domain